MKEEGRDTVDGHIDRRRMGRDRRCKEVNNEHGNGVENEREGECTYQWRDN